MDELTASKGETALRLSNATLAGLPDGILRPRYDRASLTPGIVHVGLGNFHRAHQAWYLHRLMQQGLARDWAIIGASVCAQDRAMREKLLAQDCLTTLIELDPAGPSAEVVGSMIDYLPIETGNRPLIAAMSDPAIRIVSMTITEGGYFVDPATGAFAAEHPDVRHDVANPGAPRTVFGAMIAALRNRREAGHVPFASQSCDNLQGNGAVLRQTLLSFARLSDRDLADWIEKNCSFPNSMVDCIVPATGPRELTLARGLGVDDAVPVAHENFRQWVLEDDFCAGRPDWDRVGATFSDRVHDYEAMKIRILNAGHQIIANVGEVMSHETVAECMADADILAFFRKIMHEEITPYVSAVPGMTPAAYADLIERRFANPAIHDTTRRVAFDGTSRHTGFVLPILRDALAAGGPIAGLSLVEALWARMCAGTREDGTAIEANDPHWETLRSTALEARSRPRAWLELSQLYGDLADRSQFVSAFEEGLVLIWNEGCRAALRRYCGD